MALGRIEREKNTIRKKKGRRRWRIYDVKIDIKRSFIFKIAPRAVVTSEASLVGDSVVFFFFFLVKTRLIPIF